MARGYALMLPGYSLIETVVAIFLLTGLFLAAFTVFESSADESAKIEHQLITVRLAEKISEELRSKTTASIFPLDQISFSYPYSDYFYSIDISPYSALPEIEVVSITVNGPKNGAGKAVTRVTTLLSRAPYP